MIENGTTSFTKKESVTISSDSWKEGVMDKRMNIVSGLKRSGFWPECLPEMLRRSNVYNCGGTETTMDVEPCWMKSREVLRNKVLFLPLEVEKKRKKRKTLDVNNRLLTRQQLNELRS